MKSCVSLSFPTTKSKICERDTLYERRTGLPGKITEKLIVRKSAGVGYLGLNQPEKHNAISYDMWLDIAQVISDFEADDDIRVIVVSGGGGGGFLVRCGYITFERQRQSTENIKVYDGAAGVRKTN